MAQSGMNKILEAALQVVATLFVLSAGWVALWEPSEIFLYDWWPFRQDMRIYNKIADADIVIRESEVGAHVGDKKALLAHAPRMASTPVTRSPLS